VLICPVCQHPLNQHDRRWSCSSQHHFDLAKQGYVNLLLNNAKKSKQPGDNAAMVQARHHFLNSGAYQSISDTVNQILVEHLWQQSTPNVLDLACGEGYYTHRMQQALSDLPIEPKVFGLDISKDAIRWACKRGQDVTWMVANGFKAPFQDHSLHAVVNMFNRVVPSALHQLCRPEGIVITATSGSHHLQQMKEVIYPNPRFEAFDVIKTMSSAFTHHSRHPLDFTVELNSEQMKHLIAMTPHAWRSSPETQQRLTGQEGFSLRVQVNIDCFTPLPSNKPITD